MRVDVGGAVEIGRGIGGAASMTLGSVLRCGGGSLLLDWGEDLWPAWSTTADLEDEFAFAMVVWCAG